MELPVTDAKIFISPLSLRTPKSEKINASLKSISLVSGTTVLIFSSLSFLIQNLLCAPPPVIKRESSLLNLKTFLIVLHK